MSIERAPKNNKRPEVLSREERKRTEGCLVRALESISGQTATEQDWDLRFEQLDALELLFKMEDSYNQLNNRTGYSDQTTTQDLRNSMRLICLLRESETPIGEYLKTSIIRCLLLTPEQIRNEINLSNQVLLMALAAIDGSILGGHALHLGLDTNGKFISVSDDNVEVDLRPSNFGYTCISFESMAK